MSNPAIEGVVFDGQIRPDNEPRRRLASVVSEALVDLIDSGELAVGSRLPTERVLMKRFGISRAAVREAIATLANRGLLLARPGHRPIVQRPGYDAAFHTIGSLVGDIVYDETGVWNLFETRIFVEAALVRNAALHATAQDMDELEAALEDNRAAIGDHPRFYVTDVAFHEVLYRIPRNPIYPALHKAYVEWLMSHWMAMSQAIEVDRMNHGAHASIHRAIARRDADEAERMLRSHLATAWEFVRMTFRGDL
jgi:DNA-binding FadR family transcriptional regulator